MSPDVLARKLERLSTYLGDLEGHRGRTALDIRELTAGSRSILRLKAS